MRWIRYLTGLAAAGPWLLVLQPAQADAFAEAAASVERRLNARVGVAVMDVESGARRSYNGDDRFPLMSTFKPLACAKMLADIDRGALSPNETAVIAEGDLTNWSPVTEKRVGESMSVVDACAAALRTSDNTAANIVLDAVGGPNALTAFLRSVGDETTRLDRREPELNEAAPGDARDTTTPNAMAETLRELLFGESLSADAKGRLKRWMTANEVSDALLRSVLPDGWNIADRSGAGGHGSRGIVAAIWPKTGSPLVVAIYVTDTDASFEARNAAIAEIGRAVLGPYR